MKYSGPDCSDSKVKLTIASLEREAIYDRLFHTVGTSVVTI